MFFLKRTILILSVAALSATAVQLAAQDQQQQGYGFLLVHRTTTSKPEKPAQDGRSAAPVLLSICLIVSHADAVCKAIRNATGDTLAPS